MALGEALLAVVLEATPVEILDFLLEDIKVVVPLAKDLVASPVAALLGYLQEDIQVAVPLVQALVATPAGEILAFHQEDTQAEAPLVKGLVDSQVGAHLGAILQVSDHPVEDTQVVDLVATQVEDIPVAAHLVDQVEEVIAKEDLEVMENKKKILT